MTPRMFVSSAAAGLVSALAVTYANPRRPGRQLRCDGCDEPMALHSPELVVIPSAFEPGRLRKGHRYCIEQTFVLADFEADS